MTTQALSTLPVPSLVEELTTPWTFPKPLRIIAAYALLILLALIDILIGPRLVLHLLYLPLLATIAFYTTRTGHVIGATALALALQAIILSLMSNETLEFKAYVFATIVLANIAMVMQARHFKAVSENSERLATIDPLTHLYNRRKIETSLEAELSRQKRYGGFFSIAMMDLDGFKKLNDTMGHDFGDQALTMVAKTLRNHMRESDIVARFGGDEFMILMPNTSSLNCELLCQSLCRHIGLSLTHAFSMPMGASIGITTVENTTNLCARDILMLVDKAMYQAKAAGKGCVVFRGQMTEGRGQYNL